MNTIVTRLFSILFAVLCIFSLTLAVSLTPSSAAEKDSVDRKAVKQLHETLERAKASGIAVHGDISEEALIDNYNNGSVFAQAAPNGCSTPKSLDKTAAKRWNKIFKNIVRQTHDKCYSSGSSTDQTKNLRSELPQGYAG